MTWASLGKTRGAVDDPIRDLTWISPSNTVDKTAIDDAEWSSLSGHQNRAVTHDHLPIPKLPEEPEPEVETNRVAPSSAT